LQPRLQPRLHGRLHQLTGGLAIVLTASVIAGCSGNNDDEAGVVNVGEQAVGTCLDFAPDVGAEVTELPTISCDLPHSHEIFAIKLSAAKVYPGFDALETEAQVACLGEFEPFVGINAFDSELFFSWLVPSLTSWDREDDREIICVVGNGNGAPLVGTVRGAQR